MSVSDKNIKRFERAVHQLNKVIGDCKKDDFDSCVYLSNDSLFLMDGSLGVGEEGVEDTIITFGPLNSDGGDW